MGGAESKSQADTTSLQNDGPPAQTSDDAAGGDANHTPLSNRRLVKLRDPRSPTDDVTRTPIIVPKPGTSTDDSFEDPRSPTIKIARTPIPDTDPRSPTEGVSRTPCPFTYPDPRSPTINVARTPMLQQEDTGKFEMPAAVQQETIDETPEEEQNESSNNSNSDMARLIDQSQPDENPQPDPLPSREHSNQNGLVQIDTPEYELQLSKMVEDQRLTEEAVEDSQKTSLIASSNGHSKKSRKTSLKLSLTAKIHGSQTGPPRSPLSTRNLEKDVPSVTLHSGHGLIVYDKAGSRRRQASGTPTRLVGKYEPMLDKENFWSLVTDAQ